MSTKNAKAMTDGEWRALSYDVMSVFSPGAPIDEDDLFAGRTAQIDKIIEAVLQRGRHAIVYGERGVGKTSLARTFYRRLNIGPRHVSVVPVNCDPGDTFTKLWRKVFRDLSEGNGQEVAESAKDEIDPDDVRRVLAAFDLNTQPIIVLDEFDKLTDKQAKELVANTIKALSDYSSPTTIVLVGVANSVGDLIKDHQSISRALMQVQMPRMSPSELTEIINKRLSRLGMAISKPALAQIIATSRGLPHYTHLLGQYSARRAIESKTLMIDDKHVTQAERDCLDSVDQSIRESYHKATQSPRGGNIYREVLLACALAEPDELGYFPAKAVESPLSLIMGKKYDVPMFGQHLQKLNEAERGFILERMGEPRRYRYRFAEPLMQPYVVLRGLSDNLITKQVLSGLTPSPIQPRLSNEF